LKIAKLPDWMKANYDNDATMGARRVQAVRAALVGRTHRAWRHLFLHAVALERTAR
jgi:hypothetical protein